MKQCLLFVTMFAAASMALAGDLINKDSKKHDYRLSCGGGTSVTSIASNTNQSGAVKEGCEIELNGAKYKVKGSGNVTIKDGKASE